MKKTLAVVIVVAGIMAIANFLPYSVQEADRVRPKNEAIQPTAAVSASPTSIQSQLPNSARIDGIKTVFQTFNNCGPATLSMILTYNGLPKSQDELGKLLRPYQNPQGDNDDKSVSTVEYVAQAQSYGFIAMNRPNGDIDLLKKFVSNQIPVVVKTWLHPNEDIGHFRIVTGYDNTTQTIFQTDSYEGPQVSFDYDTFMQIWQPFNYQYILVVPKEKVELVRQILTDDYNEETAWKNTLRRAQSEAQENSQNVYPFFNQAVAHYYLKDYHASVQAFEQVESRLPSRMLWYQIEPIRSYQQIGESAKVFALTDQILNHNNRAYTELYLIRGEMLKTQSKHEEARHEFEQAVYYNSNNKSAQEALNNL